MADGVEPARSLPGPVAGACIAFLAGAGVLALEITGARIFMPWFGSSILVWTNVIGVTLGAVACGNLVGGRLADRRPQAGLLAALLAAAAALTAAVPLEVPALAARYLPEGLVLDTAFALIGRASLLTALCALGPPLFVLGVCTPFLVRGAARGGRLGGAAGLIGGAGTIGSLVGTWTPVHWLIPQFGSRATCWIAAAALMLSAALALTGRPRARATALAGAVAALVLAGAADRAMRSDVAAQVLCERETLYQYMRVEDDGKQVALRLNEGLDSFHSLTVRGQVLTGAYFDHYSLFLPAAAGADGRADVLILGFAAGTIARQLLALFGDSQQLRITGVEIDPQVAELGPLYFDLPRDPRIEVLGGEDARTFLRLTERRFDFIIVDAFASQIYVPFHLCSAEFFELARRRLHDGGVLAANLSGFSLQDAPLQAIVNTAARVFGSVGTLTVPGGRNFVLCARAAGDPPDPEEVVVPDELQQLVEAARVPFAWSVHAFDPQARVLTDDRSPIELLSDRDLVEKARAQLSAATEARR